MLVMKRLDEIRDDQKEMMRTITLLNERYSNIKVEVTKEIASTAARRSFVAALIPMLVSVGALIVNIFLSSKGAPTVPTPPR